MPCIFCKMPYVSQAPVQALSATPCIFEINECIMPFFNIVSPHFPQSRRTNGYVFQPNVFGNFLFKPVGKQKCKPTGVFGKNDTGQSSQTRRCLMRAVRKP